MILDLGILLVITLPSFLFLIGFGYKSLTEKSHRIMIKDPDLHLHLFDDFIFIFSIESLFLIVANGLIVIFELKSVELGIILILIGLIISSTISICAHIKSPFLGGMVFILMFYLIGWELGYFMTYGYERFWIFSSSQFPDILGIISIIFGFFAISNLLGFEEVRKAIKILTKR